MGLRLADIKDLLDIKDRGGCPATPPPLWNGAWPRSHAELSLGWNDAGELVALGARTRDCADATGDTWWTCTTRSREGGDEP